MKKLAALVVGLIMMTAGSAWAIPTLEISATGAGSPMTVQDGGLNDIALAPGIVSWAGPLGNFLFTISAGSTTPAIGSTASPEMHIGGYATSGTSGGTFTIAFSENDFGPLANGINGFISSMNGLGGTQSFKVYYDTGNQLFAETTQIADISTLNTQEFFSGIPTSNPFSLTAVSTITVGPNASASFDNGVAPVPEPGTLFLLGAGFFGLGLFGRRRMKK